MTRRTHGCPLFRVLLAGAVLGAGGTVHSEPAGGIGVEIAVPHHLHNGEEYQVELPTLLEYGQLLFDAQWTIQEGRGRPLTKGTGAPLSDPTAPLVFPRNFNRISGTEANSCSGCHNLPRSGGGGDQVTNVFVLGQRFDFATFDHEDPADSAIPGRGALAGNFQFTQLQGIANERTTLGMFGAGYIEMLARQMSADLIAIRDSIPPGGAAALVSKGVSFGTLGRDAAGVWNVDGVEGLPATSVRSTGPDDAPSLLVRPFSQAGAVVSLREFSNNAFNHHHGIQSEERFGTNLDPDGDGFVNEMTRADVTAVTLFQAQLAVPGRVIPRNRDVERAVLLGEELFVEIGCGGCHVPALPLDDEGWIFTEPNPFNPPGNLQPGDAPAFAMNLNNPRLDRPRLRAEHGVVMVPAYTDLKLHDITWGPDDPNCESLDQLQPGGSEAFFAGNCEFLTRKLWGVANEQPFFHHGKFTTLRQAIEAHHGEAEPTQLAWQGLSGGERDAIVEFLKTLQVLPEGTGSLVVDEKGHPRSWPPRGGDRGSASGR